MDYEILIVGGGPAGLTAGIYAKRAGRKVAIIEKFMPGGQLNLIGEIENYTGFKNIRGDELALKMHEQALNLGIPFIYDEIVDYKLDDNIKKLVGRKKTYSAGAVILALGSNPRELGIEGEDKFKGQGVSYCALCDGNFFKGKTVAVVGSGDSAFSDAIYLSSLCKKVYVLTKNNLKLHNYAENELDNKNNVEIIKGGLSKKILGENSVQNLIYEKEGKENKIEVDGVFVAIGRRPETNILENKIKISERGFVLADDNMQTSTDGVFVCGDIREGNIKQIATAVGDGAIAGTEASKHILRNPSNVIFKENA